MLIKDLPSLKKFFRKINQPIFGAGVYAFNRLGPEEFLGNYKILSLYNSKDTNLIKKDIPIFCLEEKIGRKLRPRNSSTLLCHSKTKKFLKKFRNPAVLLYKSSDKIEKLAKDNSWKILNNPFRFGKELFEDKIKFREILKKIRIEPTPGKVISFPNFLRSSLKEVEKEFNLPFVIQYPKSGGGKGTFLVNNEKALIKAKESLREKPTKKIIIAKFIKGPSPSIVGCVTRFGVLSTRPQYQLLNIPLLYRRETGFGLFCGHDWSASIFSKKILIQAKEIVGKVGNYFKKLGYKGIFGLDFVLDQEDDKLYLTECNSRLLGSFPTLTMVQIENNEPPIIAFHLLEFLGIPYKINIERINNLMWQKKEGAQMFLHSPLGREGIVKGEVEAGIYKTTYNLQLTTYSQRVKNQNLEFLRQGYKFSHLRDKDEFLLTDGIQKKGIKIQPHPRLCRILTKKRVFNNSLNDITPETKNFVKLVLKKLKIPKTE